MGRIKTREIKRIAKQIVEKYPGKFSPDFETNKQVSNELGIFTSKKMRNKVAGYIVRIMKQKE